MLSDKGAFSFDVCCFINLQPGLHVFLPYLKQRHVNVSVGFESLDQLQLSLDHCI